MTDNQAQVEKLIYPVADYLENTKSRVPFGDWYDTVTGKYEHFIGRSVQGGIYMPIFKKKIEEKNSEI